MHQAARLGLDMEFVDGVSVDDLPNRVLQNAANEWTRKIRASDIACTFSHWSVWEKIAAQNEKVCVLEDDVLLSANFKAVLGYIDARQDDWNCVYDLEYANKDHTLARFPTWREGELNVVSTRIYKNKRGAAAYVLGPEAARRLLAEARNYAMMEAFLWTRNWVQQLQIEPCVAVQLDVFDSSLRFEKDSQTQVMAKAGDALQNSSWVKSKLKRLSLSLNESRQFLRGLILGTRRPLRIKTEEFITPDL